jgi:hypothetical protein
MCSQHLSILDINVAPPKRPWNLLKDGAAQSFDKMFRAVLNRLSKWPEFFQWTRRSRYALILR